MDIELRNVSYKYNSTGCCALENISLTFKSGMITALTGRSGSGKSTLLKLMNALLSPSEGLILIDGIDINKRGYEKKRVREKVSLLFQNSEDQLFEKSVMRDVQFGPENMKKGRDEAERMAVKALGEAGLERDKWEKSPLLLSGGEKRKAALAGILAMEGDVLLLDEITSSLDAKSRREIFSLLNEKKREGKTVIFSSHNAEEMAEYADRVILLEDGSVKADGTIRDIYSYDEEYMTEGAELKKLLEEKGVKCGPMDSFSQALSILSSLLGAV